MPPSPSGDETPRRGATASDHSSDDPLTEGPKPGPSRPARPRRPVWPPPGTRWSPGAPPREALREAPRPPGRQRSWVPVGFGLGVGFLLAYAMGQALLQAAEVLTLVLLSLFLAVSLEPVVQGLRKARFPRGLAVAAVVAGVAALFAAFIALVIPPITTEIDQLSKAIPIWLKQLHDHHSTLGKLEDRYHIIEKVQQQLSSSGIGTKLASGLLGAGKVIAGLLAGTVIVTTLTIYFMVGMPSIKEYAIRVVAGSRRERTTELTDRIMGQVGRFMLANVATSVLAGFATTVWAWITGIPYGTLLGFFVAIMDLIPVVGSTIAGVVVSLVALSVSWTVAIATAIFYLLFRFAEDHVTTPLTMKYVVRLHPVATTVAVLVGGALLGIIGALVAVPVATAFGLILDEIVFPKRDQA